MFENALMEGWQQAPLPLSGGSRTPYRLDVLCASIGFDLTTPCAAATRRRSVRRSLLIPRDNYARCLSCPPSGRSVPRLTRNRMAATDSRACCCRTAQGHPVWLNRDPIFESGGINLYGFVGNNPQKFVDPFGREFYEAPPLWGGGNDYPYYYGDTFLENACTIPYNAAALIANTVEGIGAFGQWALGNVLGDEDAAAAAMLYVGRQHHTIPKASMKKMPPPLRNHPIVRGVRGNPNIKTVEKAKHDKAHSSPPGNYYPGGNYNRDYDELVENGPGWDNLTPNLARSYADECMGKYFE